MASVPQHPPPVPPTTAEEGTFNDDDAADTRNAKSLKDIPDGGERKTAGALTAFVPAPGARPATFFELLAAAFATARAEQNKGPDFLMYLKKTGIKMAWIRAIVALYEETKKPDDPLAYIVKLMGLGIPEHIDVKKMQDKVVRLRVQLLQLQAENVQLRESIELEAAALQKKEEDVSLFYESKYFSEYNSDDDYNDAEQETQQQSYNCSKQF